VAQAMEDQPEIRSCGLLAGIGPHHAQQLVAGSAPVRRDGKRLEQ
jgi:hypothetical protein